MIMESAAFLAANKNPSETQHQEGAREQPLPLRHPCPHRARGQARRRARVREASHEHAFQTLAPRSSQGRRRARRQLLASPAHRLRARARRRAATAAGADRGRCVPRHRRQGHASRAIPARSTRHRHHAPRSRRWSPTSSTCRSSQVNLVTGDTPLTPDQGTTWGSLTIQARRHADPQRGGDGARRAARAGGQAPRRQARGTHVSPTASSAAAASRSAMAN